MSEAPDAPVCQDPMARESLGCGWPVGVRESKARGNETQAEDRALQRKNKGGMAAGRWE